MNTDAARTHARLLRTVAHPTRLAILEELAQGVRCVNDIRELLDVPQPKVSQHLAVLKDGGLVACHKDGVTRCYHLLQRGLVKDLLALLDRDYPIAGAGSPELCRARRNARLPARPHRGQRPGRRQRRPPAHASSEWRYREWCRVGEAERARERSRQRG